MFCIFIITICHFYRYENHKLAYFYHSVWEKIKHLHKEVTFWTEICACIVLIVSTYQRQLLIAGY